MSSIRDCLVSPVSSNVHGATGQYPASEQPVIEQRKTTGHSERNIVPGGAGFTLIELIVVIVILSVVALLVFPRLPSVHEGDLKTSARTLAAGLRYLEDKAIATKQYYRLHVNLSKGEMNVTRVLQENEEVAVTDEVLSRLALVDGTSFTDITTARLGKLSDNEAVLEFSPLGATDFVVFHLKSEDGSRFYTVALYPGSGRVAVLEGYQDGTISVEDQEVGQ
jgi:general secretion pathway protein H